MQEFVRKLVAAGFARVDGSPYGSIMLAAMYNGRRYIVVLTDMEVSNEYTRLNIYDDNTSLLRIIFTYDVTTVNSRLSTDEPHWFVDKLTDEIVVYEDQPAEFLNLRRLYEESVQPVRQNIKKEKKPFPVITILLVIANVIAYIYAAFGGDTYDAVYMLSIGGMNPLYVYEEMEFWRLFTCMFFHFGVEHLMNNMLSLVLLGSVLEENIGRVGMLVTYILGGLMASYGSAAYNYNANPYIVSAGASGAIYAVLGGILAFALFNRDNRQQISKSWLIIGILLSLFNGFRSSGVDNVAHFVGLLSGFFIVILIALIINSVKRKERT